jgi:hypothetical protein
MCERELSNWPVQRYIGAVVFGWVSCQCFGVRLSSTWDRVQHEILIVQTSIAAIFLARLALARVRRERNDAWKIYVTFSLIAMPVWEIIYEVAIGLTDPS